MTTREEVRVSATIDELMYSHRVAWAKVVLGEGADDLAVAEDPIAALASTGSAMWLDGYVPSAREALADAAGRGARLVVAVRADTADGEGLVHAIPGATVVPQTLAGGSTIGDSAAVTVEVEQPVPRELASWWLVSANVDTAAATSLVGVALTGSVTAHVRRLEDALHALQEANVRLAREHLGRHDAAAGSIVSRFERRAELAEQDAAHWRERFDFEQQLAMRHHDWFLDAKARLNQPQYVAADRIVHRLRRIPGARLVVRLLR